MYCYCYQRMAIMMVPLGIVMGVEIGEGEYKLVSYSCVESVGVINIESTDRQLITYVPSKLDQILETLSCLH